MKYKKRPLQLVLFSLLLLCLLTGLTGLARSPKRVEAAPQLQSVYPPSVVISEFRTRGLAGANDEFIEIFNATGNPINITGWELRRSTGCGAAAGSPLITFGAFTLQPGQYYLVGKSPEYTGSTDATYTSSVADDGGIALFNGATVIDQVGLCSTTAYLEGTALAPLTTDVNQSYERKLPGEIRNCNDTDNNAADFVRNSSSSNPQTSSSPAVPCLYVTNVNASPSYDGLHTSPTSFNIEVTFSGPVFVSGIPVLMLETGATDSPASYSSTSTTDPNTLIFTYNADAGDITNDLDYVSSTALSGAIFDTIGNANLTLPNPGAVNSLGANRNIQIDINDGQPPRVLSIRRQIPATTLTNLDTLTFRVIFSENVVNVDSADFVANGATGTTIGVVASPTNGYTYDVTVSGGSLTPPTFAGVVGLNIVTPNPTIDDLSGNALPSGEPPIDETYDVRRSLTAVITRETTPLQPATDNIAPVNFVVTFSSALNNAALFDPTDIAQGAGGTATGITWSIVNTGNNRIFKLSATAILGDGLLVPSIIAGRVNDLYGNANLASTTAEPVDFSDTTRPTVTITRATGQAGSTTVLPIRFTVTFSEAINAALFTPGDIRQSATSSPASGITWTIADSGNHIVFTISATAVAVGGNITPFIPANAVIDTAGNGNFDTASTATVNYGIPPTPTITPTRTVTPVRTPTRTRTPTRVPTVAPAQLVAINEFVPRPGHDWNSDGEVNVLDEYVEIINHGTVSVNLSGWSLDDEANIGSDPFRLPSVTIQPGERLVFYGSQTGLLLSDGGDGVRLLRPNGQLIDAYNYTVARYSDQSYCRLPDDGGLDDWNQNCYPTPGLQNSLSGDFVSPGSGVNEALLCPIADTLPENFVIAECAPYGNNIWRRAFWDATGWYGEQILPDIQSRWDVFAD